jgi:hypothetical protein
MLYDFPYPVAAVTDTTELSTALSISLPIRGLSSKPLFEGKWILLWDIL